MIFNGRLLQEELDKRADEIYWEIYDLKHKLNLLQEFRKIIEPYTFYECPDHGVYGIRSPDPNECKMCKRLGK